MSDYSIGNTIEDTNRIVNEIMRLIYQFQIDEMVKLKYNEDYKKKINKKIKDNKRCSTQLLETQQYYINFIYLENNKFEIAIEEKEGEIEDILPHEVSSIKDNYELFNSLFN